MSRQQLADAINRADDEDCDHVITSQWVARIEQGLLHWPNAGRRVILRMLLHVRTDEELGLFDTRRR